QLAPQRARTTHELSNVRLCVTESQVVGDAARSFERESEIVGHLLRPLREHRLGRHAVKGVVDLHRREVLGVVAQHLDWGKLFELEGPYPLLEGVAAGSREQAHRWHASA